MPKDKGLFIRRKKLDIDFVWILQFYLFYPQGGHIVSKLDGSSGYGLGREFCCIDWQRASATGCCQYYQQ